MTALDAVCAYLPATQVRIETVMDPHGQDPTQTRVFRRFYGLDSVRLDPDVGLAGILLSAARKLTALRGREHLVRYVIAARTMPQVMPDPLSVLPGICENLGLTPASAFTVTQHACASGLLAVDLAGRLLTADGDDDAVALVLTGEKAFTPAAQFIPSTTVMGEGTAAVLVRARGDCDRVLSYATCSRGEYNAWMSLTPELTIRFQEEYPVVLGQVIRAAVREAGLELADVGLLLPHNVNRVSWIRLCEQLGYPLDRVFLENIPVTGHCFCADPFINFHSAVEQGRLTPGAFYLMVSVGLGSVFSAMVLQH